LPIRLDSSPHRGYTIVVPLRRNINMDVIFDSNTGEKHTHNWEDNEGKQAERLHKLSYSEMVEGLQARREFLVKHQLTNKTNWQNILYLREIELAIEYFTRKAEEEQHKETIWCYDDLEGEQL